MPCRVVHLTSVHHPFDTRILHKECKSLVMAGYEVVLVAPRAEGDTTYGGVKIRAVAVPRNRKERLLRTVREVYRTALSEEAKIYHFHDPELMLVGALLKLRGRKVICDVHEDYSVSMGGKQWLPSGLHRPAALGVRLCEAALAHRYDRVVAATPKIAEKFDPRRTALIQNFPWINELRPLKYQPYEKRDAIVAYVGWLSDTRGLREMTDAIRIVAKCVPAKLVIGGKVISGATAHSYKNGAQDELIEHKGLLNRTQVAELLAESRVGLVVLHPTGNYRHAQPTKLFEYMSAGLPVVASNFPIWKEIVESARCGLTVDPLDPGAIAEALLWLLRNKSEAEEMGQRGRQAVAERFNWEHESKQLLATYAELQLGD